MLDLLNLTKLVYRGYKGDGERHSARLSLIFAVAILVGLNPVGLSNDAATAVGVIVSVLAGFSFTALFSSHSHSTADLPPPKSESDRQDIRNLQLLFENFRIRARYFLNIAVLCLFATFLISVPLDLEWLKEFMIGDKLNAARAVGYSIWTFSCFLVRFMTLVLFLEILYSFYRLSETIFAILDTRRRYLKEVA